MKEVLSYGLAFAGLIVTAIAVAAIVGKQKYAAMQPMIVHMPRTGSQRAEMMCHNSKGTFLELLGASIPAGALTYSREAAVIAQGTRPAYDVASKPVALQWTQVLKRTRTGRALAVVLGRGHVLPEVERMFGEGRYASASQPEPASAP